jgi:proline dehydrogenase
VDEGENEIGARVMREHVSRALWACWTPVARHAAKHYVAGETLTDALAVARHLADRGRSVTLCYWDSGTERPRDVADRYRAALHEPRAAPFDWYLSIKAPALKYSTELAADVLDDCRAAGVRAHFDAHGPETADATFRLIEGTRSTACSVGCTLPGRWRRSLDDADWATANSVSVRVVKGQWADPGDETRDAREGFLQVIDRLAGRARHVGVASHDPAVARPALERLRAAGTPCELELLYGLPTFDLPDVARELSVAVRMYVPYGHAWLPYCLSNLRNNPGMLRRVLHDVIFA